MPTTNPDVVLPQNTWVNLYSSSGITVGTAVTVANKSGELTGYVLLALSATQPSSTSLGFPLNANAGTNPQSTASIDSGEAGLWGICLNGQGLVTVESGISAGGGSSSSAALPTGLTTIANSVPVNQSPFSSVTPMTVNTVYAAGSAIEINCSVAGNVSLQIGGVAHIVPVEIGLNVFPYAVTEVNSVNTTATATYTNMS